MFTKQITALLSDEEYREFQGRLIANPALGDRIPGGRGIRKTRLQLQGRGTRGGARVIYYWAVRRDIILLLFAYAKNAMSDLTPNQVAELAKLAKREFTD